MSKKNYDQFYRQSHRLKGFDYSSPGFYFVTICTNGRLNFFGQINKNKIKYFKIGLVAKKFWLEIPNHYPFIKLDEFIVMPNHIHGIIVIGKSNNVATCNCPSLQINPKMDLRHYNKFYKTQSKNLSAIIRGYKSSVKKYANVNNLEFNWQSRFYDRIIRNEEELYKIQQYIIDNPINWKNDRNNINK